LTERRPLREVRASYDEETLVVYQAYDDPIADAALQAATFVPPFRRGRMTWIKPSFLWMMHRSSWATASGQRRVLAVRLSRDGFGWALAHASLSHYDPAVHASRESWREELARSPVRVQWDPERSILLEPLPWRAIQVGLSGEAVDRYVDEWIVSVEDRTATAHAIGDLVTADRVDEAQALLPRERTLPVDPVTARRLGTTEWLE
jgi:Domain of unknown function (DUF4291)